MTFLYRYSIRHPVAALAVALLVTAAVAPGVARLRLRTDGHALVPSGRPQVLLDQAIREEFDAQDIIVVLIRTDHPSGIFSSPTLELIQTLTVQLQQVEGVKPYNVSSLDTEHSHRVRPGTLINRRFLEPLPSGAEELARLRDDLRRIELHTGTIVSADGQAAAILMGIPDDSDRTRLFGTVQDIVAARGPRAEQIDVLGAPVAEALLGTHILEDLGVPRSLLGLRPAPDEAADGRLVPRSLHELRSLVGRRVGLVPIAIIIMALIFAACFRSPTAAMLPLMEVGACLAFVFGLMGWLGVPIYLTIAVMPVILTAVGVADEIHVFTRYTQLLRTRADLSHREALLASMDEMWVPVVKTSVTTALGFLCFAFSPLGPVRAFGVFTAVGIIFCMLWSLSAVPAMLVLINPRRFVGEPAATTAGTHPGRPFGQRVFARLGALVIGRGRFVVLAVAIGAVLAAPLGVSRLVVQDSWIDGFAPGSTFYRATQAFNSRFLGTHLLLVRVEAATLTESGRVHIDDLDHHEIVIPAGSPADPDSLVGHRVFVRRDPERGKPPSTETRRRRSNEWRARIESVTRDGDRLVLHTARRSGSPILGLRPEKGEEFDYEIKVEPMMLPENIRRIGDLEAFIELQRDLTVGGVIGSASYVATTNFMSRGLREGTRIVPDTPDEVARAWHHFQRVRGLERARQVVDPDYSRSLVTVFLKNANYVDVRALMELIRDYERRHLAPHGLSLSFAGDVAVSQTVIAAIVSTQRWSLIGSLIGILLVTTLLGRSIRFGVLSVLPCALAVLINFAVMGWTGMPLGVATSMFAGMTLGIGVDYAIHLLERFRFARERGLELPDALVDAVAVTGPAIFIDALAVALGFGILTLSQVPANARLGALLMLSILGCLAATLLLLPALLRITARTATKCTPSDTL